MSLARPISRYRVLRPDVFRPAPRSRRCRATFPRKFSPAPARRKVSFVSTANRFNGTVQLNDTRRHDRRRLRVYYEHDREYITGPIKAMHLLTRDFNFHSDFESRSSRTRSTRRTGSKRGEGRYYIITRPREHISIVAARSRSPSVISAVPLPLFREYKKRPGTDKSAM